MQVEFYVPLSMGHDSPCFVRMNELVRTDTNEEVYIREREFGLSKL